MAKGYKETKLVWRRVKFLWSSPFFVYFTLVGNCLIVLAALLFHTIEANQNPEVQSFLDSLVWTVGVVTTVGSSPVTPVTQFGKILSIFLMLGGSLFLWSYMGLIVSAIISPELAHIEREVRHIESEVDVLQSKSLSGQNKPGDQKNRDLK